MEGRKKQTAAGRKKPPAGRKTRLAGLGTFDTECRKCFCVTFGKSNKTYSAADFALGLVFGWNIILPGQTLDVGLGRTGKTFVIQKAAFVFRVIQFVRQM